MRSSRSIHEIHCSPLPMGPPRPNSNGVLAAQLSNAVLAAQAFQHNADLLFSGMMPACGSANIPDCLFSAVRYALARLSRRCSSTGYDEPAILSYAISSFCPTSADGLHRVIATIALGVLADPEDIARFGPLSSPNVRHGNTGGTGDYPPEEVAQMTHSLAVKAITTP
jgi:hypothetical protein